MHSSKPLSAAAFVAMLALAGPAAAQFAFLDHVSTGAGTCQAALPSFEGQVRKRPLALQNEGTEGAFVSCSPPQYVTLHDEIGLLLRLVNHTASSVAISCTGVSIVDTGAALYVPKTLNVPAGTERSQTWGANDGGANWAVSCNLPPGTGIGRVIVHGISVD